MLGFLNKFAEYFLRAIAGLLTFFGEAAYRLARLIFSMSPFLMLIALGLILSGNLGALVGVIGVVILLAVGTAWASRRDLHRGVFSRGVVVAILVSNVILTVAIFFAYRFGSNIRELLPWENGSEVATDFRAIKISTFSDSLRESLYPEPGRGKPLIRTSRFRHSISELRAMAALSQVPIKHFTNTLDYCRGVVDRHRDDNATACKEVAAEIFAVLIEIEASAACELLYKIQADGGSLEEPARKVSLEICGV